MATLPLNFVKNFGNPKLKVFVVKVSEELSFEDIKKLNVISRIIKSINYLIWGDV